MSQAEVAGSVGDAAAAISAIERTGYPGVVIVGASIGANIALVSPSGNSFVKGVCLLSPGDNYWGIKTGTAASQYGDRPAMLCAAKGDAGGS